MGTVEPAVGGALLAVTLAVSALGTVTGAGGGFLLVPLLILVAHMAPPVAVGTGLAIVLLNALLGLAAHLRDGRVDLRLGVPLAAAGIPSAYAGAHLVRFVDAETFRTAFGLFLVVLGPVLFFCLQPARRAGAPAEGTEFSEPGLQAALPKRRFWALVAVGLAVGLIGGFFGVGGGFLLVPLLVQWLGVPAAVAAATALLQVGLNAATGLAVHLAGGTVAWPVVAVAGLGAVAGTRIGVVLSRRLSETAVMQVLAVLVTVVGLELLWQRIEG